MSSSRVPVTIITGPLGSGKTTLLRHLLDQATARLAIVMNEFGEIAIDSRVVEGKNVRLAELGGGCVCCSLLGEFEAAVEEIIESVDPDRIVVETTGLAEPDALAFDIEENLRRVRLDGVVTVVDADAMVRFPSLGHTTRLQIEAADQLLLNKVDLVSESDLEKLEARLQDITPAPVIRTRKARVDVDLLFGIGRQRDLPPPRHVHQPEFDSISFRSDSLFERSCFQAVADQLDARVYRAKGFIRFEDESCLFNFVGGRWQLEPFPSEDTVLVFIGRDVREIRQELWTALAACRRKDGSGAV